MKKDSNAIKTVKTIATVVGGVGVGAIISNAVKHVSPTTGTGAIMKLCIGVGTMLLGGLACDASSKYAETRIDEVVAILQSSEEETSEYSKEEVVEK